MLILLEGCSSALALPAMAPPWEIWWPPRGTRQEEATRGLSPSQTAVRGSDGEGGLAQRPGPSLSQTPASAGHCPAPPRPAPAPDPSCLPLAAGSSVTASCRVAVLCPNCMQRGRSEQTCRPLQGFQAHLPLCPGLAVVPRLCAGGTRPVPGKGQRSQGPLPAIVQSHQPSRTVPGEGTAGRIPPVDG